MVGGMCSSVAAMSCGTAGGRFLFCFCVCVSVSIPLFF